MEGLELFCEIAFGTSFDPKQKKRRKKKSKVSKCGKSEEHDLEPVTQEPSVHDTSDSSEESEVEVKDEPNQKPAKKKEKKKLSTLHLLKIRQEEVVHFRRVHKIYITGEDVPEPIEDFNQLASGFDVSSGLLENISNLGYMKPTPIQMQAIPLMMHNRQLLACAPTGSGKTAAFLIPLIHNLKEPKKGGIRAVILAPTRELVKQIHSFCVKLSEGTGLRPLIIENVNEVKTRPKFLRKHDILISTPNRLIYLLKNDPPVLKLNKVRWLVVDECDKMFEVGKDDTSFRDQLAFVYNACDSSHLRRAMFSATFSHDVEEWCRLNLDSLVCVAIGTKNTAVETIKQELKYVGCESGKLLALQNFIQEGFLPPVLVFVQSKERAKELYNEIVYACNRVGVIHADLSQGERDKVVENFTNGKVYILICTELMGRGIDFKGVNTVVNYDFPPSAITYIHRIGRTGRAGEEGRAITYFSDDDVTNLKSIAQVMKNAGCEVPAYIMSLRTKRKRNTEFTRPIKREKISTLTTYNFEKKFKKRNIMKKKLLKGKKKKPQDQANA